MAAIRNFRIEGTSCKINLALNGLPEFTAYPGAPGPHHRRRCTSAPASNTWSAPGTTPSTAAPRERPLLELTIPTMYDPSLAPPGKHIMGIFLQYAPYTLREGTWDELREPFGDRVISLIEEYAPNIRSIIEHRQVLTPLDLERRFGITGGNIFHGEMSLDQMFVMRPVAGWARYRTPVHGPVSVRLGRASRRRRDGRSGLQLRARDAAVVGLIVPIKKTSTPLPPARSSNARFDHLLHAYVYDRVAADNKGTGFCLLTAARSRRRTKSHLAHPTLTATINRSNW